jgi:hypothetical protein
MDSVAVAEGVVSVALARVIQRTKLGDPTLKGVLMNIVLHVEPGSDPPICYPGVACLMWESEYSRATVKRSVEDLQDMGILEPVDVPRGRGHVKGYVIRVDQLPLRRPWAEEKEQFRPKRGSQKTPFKDERRRGKGAHSDHKRGSLAIEKGLTESREVNLRSRSLKQSVHAPLARTRASAPGDGFDAFWAVYPKKRSRSDAEKAWRKLAPSPELRQRIQDAIAVQRTDPRWVEDDGRWIPFPAKWITGRRWEDHVVVERPKPQPRAPDPELQWLKECEVLHGRDCGLSKSLHDARMCLDRDRAKAKAASDAGERNGAHTDIGLLSDATG